MHIIKCSHPICQNWLKRKENIHTKVEWFVLSPKWEQLRCAPTGELLNWVYDHLTQNITLQLTGMGHWNKQLYVWI
jgi:hypothetical protein